MNIGRLAVPYWNKLRTALEKYKFVLLMILIGILLLALPNFGSQKSVPTAAISADNTFDISDMEQKLEDALSKIEGAGNVTVMLTLKTGTRQILAENGDVQQKDEQTQRSNSTVILSKGSGYQEVVSVQEIFPQYQGALVVCAGGGNPAVKLKLVEAVSALTGLGSDKISICKGK